MLHSVRDLRECKIRARDGDLGSVDDFFFDDRTWLVRYVVVDTSGWLSGRLVLLPRENLGTPHWDTPELDVDLSRREIEESPGVETDPPHAHDARTRYYRSFVWTSHAWGGFIGGAPVTDREPEHLVADPQRTHLRSAREIVDYRIEAEDGRLGHVEDFLLSDEDWALHFFVVDTRNWLPGKKVVLPTDEIVTMQWSDATVRVSLGKEEIRNAPPLDLAKTARAAGPHRL